MAQACAPWAGIAPLRAAGHGEVPARPPAHAPPSARARCRATGHVLRSNTPGRRFGWIQVGLDPRADRLEFGVSIFLSPGSGAIFGLSSSWLVPPR